MGWTQFSLIKYLAVFEIFLFAGCAESVDRNIQIQPPPVNNAGLSQDGKQAGTLTGTTFLRGSTYYIFKVTRPFCFHYAPQAARPELPPELKKFSDSCSLVKKDAGTFCATGDILFVLSPQTNTLVYLIPQEKIDRVMAGK